MQDPKNTCTSFCNVHCIQQAKVTAPAYALFMKLDNDWKVTSITCQCDFGSNGECKHSYALINTEREESRTDESCQWKDPTKAGQKKIS